MSNLATGALLAAKTSDQFVRHPDGALDFTISSELSCHYDPATALLWTLAAPRGIPCFSADLLRSMERGSDMIESHFADPGSDRPLRHVVIRSLAPRAFNVGGDLGYFIRLITTQDRARLAEYARTAIGVAYRNYTGHGIKGVTTVALLEGDALGGGFESALSCDVIIAEEHVKAGFPEVLFNMFPGMGGLSFLARRVGRRAADEMTRTGRLYPARELLAMGVIDEVIPTGEGAEAVLRMIRRRETQHEAHAAMNAVDRLLRPVTLDELYEVVRMWVDCAMALSPRGLEWMKRLHVQQIANFGTRLSVVPA
jgi:DSF synthase